METQPSSGMGRPSPPRSVSMPNCTANLNANANGNQKSDVIIRKHQRIGGLRTISESRSCQPYQQPLCDQLNALDALSLNDEDTFNETLPLETSNSLPSSLLTASPASPAASRALNCPEILMMIFEQLEALNVIPQESAQRRRKPCSLRHARMIYPNASKAAEEWANTSQSLPATETGFGVGFSNCLLVNRKWFQAAKSVLDRSLYFSSETCWRDFVRNMQHQSLHRKPALLVLHKLAAAQQLEIESIAFELGGRLEWLEFYSCSGLAPSLDLLKGGRLTKIVLPGCSRVTDRTLQLIAEQCPALEYLDLRACEAVSDKGLKIIAKYCPQLTLLNVGRTNNGELITYKGIKHLARQTKLNTLGAAGCHIDDRAIWEIALNRGEDMQRLSLNNCRLLTDASLPRVLGYMPNLSVLEMRGCLLITHMRPFVLFKSWKEKQGFPPLVEGCEVLEQRMQSAAQLFYKEVSRNIIQDLQTWVLQED